ncbi:hypothetical protein AB0I50_41260, partial [Streptomyces prunicolor]
MFSHRWPYSADFEEVEAEALDLVEDAVERRGVRQHAREHGFGALLASMALLLPGRPMEQNYAENARMLA